jgi:hypothetical protein
MMVCEDANICCGGVGGGGGGGVKRGSVGKRENCEGKLLPPELGGGDLIGGDGGLKQLNCCPIFCVPASNPVTPVVMPEPQFVWHPHQILSEEVVPPSRIDWESSIIGSGVPVSLPLSSAYNQSY